MLKHKGIVKLIFSTNNFSIAAITVHRDYIASERLELRFHNNTLQSPTTPSRALEFNERFTLSLKQLRYDNEYSCQDLDMEQKPPQPLSVFFRIHSDAIYFRRADSETSNDALSYEDANFAVLSKIIEWDCQRRSNWLYWLLGILALLLLFIIVAVVVWMQVAKKRRLRKMVILPEPRTYKETQIVYQIENAGLLKTDM